MNIRPILRHSALALALGIAAAGAQAATQTVVNGDFSTTSNGNTTANPWTDSSVSFSGNHATFDNTNDSLWQSLGSFVAGTKFDVSFLFGAPGSGTDLILNYSLQYSTTSNFASTSNLSSASYNSDQEGDKSFNNLTLANGGYVRIYFDALGGADNNDNAIIDNVSVLATAPIPEPETYALMLGGLGVIGFVARRRRPQA